LSVGFLLLLHSVCVSLVAKVPFSESTADQVSEMYLLVDGHLHHPQKYEKFAASIPVTKASLLPIENNLPSTVMDLRYFISLAITANASHKLS